MAHPRRVFVDVRPLRESREFRLLYGGELISFVGTQITAVAAPILVFRLTGSSLAVGMLGLAQLVPLVLGSFLGGTLADAHDRRRILMAAQVLMGLMSVGLALNAGLERPNLALIYVLTAAQSGFAGLDHPTRAAVVPTLVDRGLLASALSLNQLGWQLGQVVGPLVAGVVVTNASIATAFWLDVLTFALALGALVRMAPLPPEGGGQPASLRSLREGMRFLRGRQALQGSFVIDIGAMVFGMPRALFPAIGAERYGGDETVVGLLYAAPAAGALVGAALSGWVGRVDRQGRAVVLAVGVWGVCIAVFGLVAWLPLALLMLAAAGAADVVSAVFRGSILQTTVPDRLRGRLSAIHIAVVTGGPRLGDAEAGAVAALTSPIFSVVSGGLACVAVAAGVAHRWPELDRWRLSVNGVAGDGGELEEPPEGELDVRPP